MVESSKEKTMLRLLNTISSNWPLKIVEISRSDLIHSPTKPLVHTQSIINEKRNREENQLHVQLI